MSVEHWAKFVMPQRSVSVSRDTGCAVPGLRMSRGFMRPKPNGHAVLLNQGAS